MQIKLFQFLATSFLLLFSLTMLGQESINASGRNATAAGGSISYSVGQIVYTTNTGTNGSVARGVQQPFEISVVLGIENHDINLVMTVSPNPTTDFVTLKVDKYQFEKLMYQLYDINGKEFISDQTSATETQISIGNLPSAIYFLKIKDNNKEIKTFKILKN